jgi:tRNA nucleotidyltransferase (CCA-adding enzyme)
MSKYIEKLPPELLGIIKLAKDISFKLGYKSYLVGGFVRDLILKRKNLDLDITVEGDGIEFARTLASHLKAEVTFHQRFGTATLITPEGFKIDIATSRKELYPKPAMLPQVEKGDIADDLKRRDFTINALAISIYPETKEEIIDFFGGYQDLLRKKIRVLHDKSFIDDPTRILRAIRFEQRFGFCIEKNTLRLIKEALSLNMLQRLSPHRLRDELILILKEENVLKSILRIEELLGWDFLIPGLRLNRRKIKLLNSIIQTIDWYSKEFPQRRSLDTWLMYLIGLLDGLDKERTVSFLNRFSFTKGQTKRILSYIVKHKQLMYKLKKKLKPSRIYTYLEPLSYEVILLLKAKSKDKNLNKNIENFLKVYNNIKLNITGKDLKEMGISEGPCYQKIFKRLLYAKLDKNIETKEEELRFVRNLIRG